MRTLLAGLVLVVAIAAAPASARTDATWKRHAGPGFSISLPSTWVDASKDRERLLARVRKLYAGNGQLATMIDGLISASRGANGVKMIAFDLEPGALRSGFATNLNVLRSRTNMLLPLWREAAIHQLTSMPFVKQPIWSQPVRLAAGKAIRFRYKAQFSVGGKPLLVAITQYGLVKAGTAHVLTYTTLPKLDARYRALFEHSARTLRLG
jgi:hypothetical protein